MQADRWNQIAELFDAVRQLPPHRRDEFLRRAEADAGLVAEVESMLEAAEAPDPVLDHGPLSSVVQRAPTWTPGHKLDSFEIVALIGRGGMGEVYRARDLRLHREVAIKTLLPQFASDRDRLARFEREARAASALNHPNIVSVHDVGRDGAVSFIVTEFVDGQSLAAALAHGFLPAYKVVDIAAQIADGLAAAHAAGIVHRDLKPPNIMLRRDGRIKILDFGLARQQPPDRGSMTLTDSGVILGTVGYMSPEQVRGQAVDPRSDLFSFGVMLYEMLSCRPPFTGKSSVEVMNAILTAEPSEMPRSVTPALNRIVRHCLEKDPERRFQSAADLGFALTSVALTPPRDVVRKPRAFWRLWPTVIGAVAAMLFAALWWSNRSRPVGIASDRLLHRLTSDGGLTTDATISSDGKLVAYASDIADPTNLDIYVRQVDSGTAVRITADPADDYDPSFSPDGSQIAFRSERNGGGIYLVPALGGDARLLIRGGRRPRFSPDGTMLMYSVGFGKEYSSYDRISIQVQRLSGGRAVSIGPDCMAISAGSAVWSPDSTRILFNAACAGDKHAHLVIFTPDGTRMTKSPALSLALVDQWLPNPSRLLVPSSSNADLLPSASFRGNSDGASIETLPISPDGARIIGPPKRVTFGTGNEKHARAARDGRMVLSAIDTGVHVWDLGLDGSAHATGTPRQLTLGGAMEFLGSLSRDGSTITIESSGAGRPVLYSRKVGSGKQVEVPYHGFDFVTSVLNADATNVAYGTFEHSPDHWAGFMYETPLLGGIPLKLWGDGRTGYLFWDWSPDGRTLLYVATDHVTWTGEFNLESRSSTALLADPEIATSGAHFSSDGRWVAFTGSKGQASAIYIAPFRKTLVPKREWITVTDGSQDDKAWFSHDGRLIFFTSVRDGFRCIWAQRLTREMHPAGAPFAVYHFHQRRRSLGSISSVYGAQMVAGANLIVFNQLEVKGDIWLLEPKH